MAALVARGAIQGSRREEKSPHPAKLLVISAGTAGAVGAQTNHDSHVSDGKGGKGNWPRPRCNA
eukprot:CAMPEP_0197932668 /NCGR_PEP_ID=MMETSP1439-20131203/108951_1 /TAXON_ID=66791 /ORGANISM="Gonyaulax spinifera, Strain CCMP409" /LENGTH=63 /DNA_ID=CAMNT_0043555463 /DNA_START=42 /DNA_END=231 /DNA_ORIENTATION=+